MTKKTPTPINTPDSDPWETEVAAIDPADKAAALATEITETDAERITRAVQAQRATEPEQPEYDIDGLMTDFPTATELERFVYDQTGHVLNLKGRANKLKYQVAMDVLNGITVDVKFTGGDNPYVDRSELVPVEDLKPVPDRDPGRAVLPAHWGHAGTPARRHWCRLPRPPSTSRATSPPSSPRAASSATVRMPRAARPACASTSATVR